jgi:hypothetical protein
MGYRKSHLVGIDRPAIVIRGSLDSERMSLVAVSLKTSDQSATGSNRLTLSRSSAVCEDVESHPISYGELQSPASSDTASDVGPRFQL